MTTARRIVPETVQTSAMDCGPAALRSLMAGFDLEVGYGGLREACRTDVDGTSINALEATAKGLGLDCSQLMVPVDHVVHDQLPALLVVLLPSGKGGGLSDMFGGGMGAAAQGSTMVEKNLDRATVLLAVVFTFTTLALGLLMSSSA